MRGIDVAGGNLQVLGVPSPDDDLRRVSTAVMASLLKGVVASVGELAEGGQMEFEAAIPGDLAATAEKCWRDLFGGW